MYANITGIAAFVSIQISPSHCRCLGPTSSSCPLVGFSSNAVDSVIGVEGRDGDRRVDEDEDASVMSFNGSIEIKGPLVLFLSVQFLRVDTRLPHNLWRAGRLVPGIDRVRLSEAVAYLSKPDSSLPAADPCLYISSIELHILQLGIDQGKHTGCIGYAGMKRRDKGGSRDIHYIAETVMISRYSDHRIATYRLPRLPQSYLE